MRAFVALAICFLAGCASEYEQLITGLPPKPKAETIPFLFSEPQRQYVVVARASLVSLDYDATLRRFTDYARKVGADAVYISDLRSINDVTRPGEASASPSSGWGHGKSKDESTGSQASVADLGLNPHGFDLTAEFLHFERR